MCRELTQLKLMVGGEMARHGFYLVSLGTTPKKRKTVKDVKLCVCAFWKERMTNCRVVSRQDPSDGGNERIMGVREKK